MKNSAIDRCCSAISIVMALTGVSGVIDGHTESNIAAQMLIRFGLRRCDPADGEDGFDMI